jgi:hypothetical protein
MTFVAITFDHQVCLDFRVFETPENNGSLVADLSRVLTVAVER